MSRNRFVIPTTKRINLSEEEWIEVKQELNAGEERKQTSLALVPIELNGRIIDRVDWSKYEILRAYLWLVKWHIHNQNGDVPDLTIEAIQALDVETFEEINNALYKHILESAVSKKAQKNPGGTNADQISL